MADFSMFVPNVHFEQIPIKNLVSNQEYQRNISEQHVLNAAAHFDLYQINPVKVSRRNGVNYVFNGQHTVEIVALASGSRDTPVWCMIYDDLNYDVGKHLRQVRLSCSGPDTSALCGHLGGRYEFSLR